MASSNSKPNLSIREKLSFVKSMLSIPVLAPHIALKHLVLRKYDYPNAVRAIAAHALRTITEIPPRQQIALFPALSTGRVIFKFCRKAQLTHRSVALPHDGTLHFVGPEPSSNSKVLLYFHGGGYLNAASPTHTPFAIRCAQSSCASLIMLETTLSPIAPYPRQLLQAIEAIQYVLTLTSAPNIILAGDSAGAHLITCLLSQIMHPDGGEERIDLGGKLGGVCLISPMLSCDLDKESYDYNAKKDYLSRAGVEGMIDVFAPSDISFLEAIRDPRLSPADAPVGWWRGLPVERVLITVGSWEVFYDSCNDFANALKRDIGESKGVGREVKIEVVVGEGEWHAAPVVEPLFGFKEKRGGTSKAIVKWMSGVDGGVVEERASMCLLRSVQAERKKAERFEEWELRYTGF